jgi:hypothetical protein
MSTQEETSDAAYASPSWDGSDWCKNITDGPQNHLLIVRAYVESLGGTLVHKPTPTTFPDGEQWSYAFMDITFQSERNKITMRLHVTDLQMNLEPTLTLVNNLHREFQSGHHSDLFSNLYSYRMSD